MRGHPPPVEHRTTHVSVDVLALRYEHSTRRLSLALHERPLEPFAGRLALPGVLLLRGERIGVATTRALAKVGATALGTGQLVTFDEPNRDPRGPTLSIATWSVTAAPGSATWVGFDGVPGLAFDHNRIVTHCRPLLAAMLWRDPAFTGFLTGPEFTVTDALALHTALAGAAPDRGNLNRTLAGIPGLLRTGRAAGGPGRPGAVWTWTDPPGPTPTVTHGPTHAPADTHPFPTPTAPT